jgi:signal transduction histidine kinase/CheY-like chemotaxis protein
MPDVSEDRASAAYRLQDCLPRDAVVLESPFGWNSLRLLWLLSFMGAIMLAEAAWVIILQKQARAKSGTTLPTPELTQNVAKDEQADAARRKALEAAEDANRAKSEFLTNMSHELRTPMTAVIGMTELVLTTQLDAEQRTYLELLKSSGDSLLKIINQILDFSNIEAGKLELEPAAFDLEDVVDEAVRPLALQAYQKGLEIACSLDPQIPSPLFGDSARVKQLLASLVENAIKFTAKGEVIVRAWAESKAETDISLHLAVADTGVGIPADKIETIFDAFRQVDGSLTRPFQGTGLGLAICSELARMMGGTIRVESAAGRGSTFHVSLRLGLSPGGCAQRDHGPADLLRGAPVLVADDHPATREIVADMLRRGGMAPTTVDGAEAVFAVIRATQRSAAPLRLALIDAQMPQMNGLEVTRAVREMERKTGGHLLIVTMTAHPLASEEEAFRNAGADGYLAKPLQSGLLFELIHLLTAAPAASAAGPAPSSAVFDQTSFLSRLEGDHVLARELTTIFLEQYPKLLDGVRQAAEKGDLRLLERAAHAVKGSVADVAAPQAFEAGRTLEQTARDGKADEVGAALKILEAALERLVNELREFNEKAA